MGSVSSPPLLPSSAENRADSTRIFASFCARGLPTWLESYSPSENVWRRAGPIPGIADNQSLKGFAMVSLGDSVYVVGGRLCRKDLVDDDDVAEADVAVRPDVFCYDIAGDEWTVCAPLLVARFDFACAACDGKIYVAGGQCVLSRGRGTSAAEAYDPVHDRWDPLPNMSMMRHKCVGVAWHGRFHAVGGFAEREDSEGLTMLSAVERSSAEVYDAERGEWELMAGMWQLDVPPNQIVAVEGRRLFSSGDCLNTWKGHIEAYDGKLNIWSIIEWSHVDDLSSLFVDSSIGSPRHLRRTYLTMAPIGTRLYFLAGYRVPGNALRSLSVVHTFDTLATTDGAAWTSSEVLEVDGNKELCAHCCTVLI